MVSRFFYCIISIVLFLFLFSKSVKAHTTQYVTYADRADLAVSEELNIEDPRRGEPDMSGSDLLYVATREVKPRLIYGREHRSDVGGKYWSYRVRYNLYESGSTTVAFSDTLLIEHLAGGGIYEELDRYMSTTGSVRLEIIGIEASADGFATLVTGAAIDALVPDDIRLELTMEIERYDYLPPTAQPSGHIFDLNVSPHHLYIAWPYVSGAEYYEVEWAYRDDEGGIPVAEIFERATRIETNTNHYNIPLSYPRGNLFYRIRAVGRFIRGVNGNYNHLKYGTWYEPESHALNTGFEEDRNWQTTTVFAEEGKHKQVISYFDEGLRNRQSQTNLSSDSLTLVSTTHYDVEGRPALNILPVPARNNNDLFYKPQFNRNDAGNTYNRINFDRDLGNGCQYNLPDSLSTAIGAAGLGGAGYYFSPIHASDGNADDLYKEYLPDAEGYPMTQVRLMNDGTGRVMAQSGVGKFYQLGSERETKYFYDDASNTQLRRLFGSDVGDAKYYKRNLVMDANGQMSVSYIDAAGRVVATALTGVVPSNVQQLPSYGDARTIVEDLMLNNVIDTASGKSVTISTVMNEVENNMASFNYTISGRQEFIELLGGIADTCLNCRYEVVFRAVDPCGAVQPLNSHGTQYDELRQMISNASDCSADGTYAEQSIQFNILMTQIGIYRIYKELCVLSPGAEEYYHILESFFPDTTNILNTLTLDSLSCYITCEQRCRIELKDSLGRDPSAAEIAACVGLDPDCNRAGLIDAGVVQGCNAIYYQIIDQVSPGGCKYEQGEWWDSRIDTMNFAFLNDSTGSGIDQSTRDSLTMPQSWNEAWAAQLATLHPEYCRYLECLHSDSSRHFDYTFLELEDWNNTVWPSGTAIDGLTDAITTADPMFNTSYGFYINFQNLGLDQTTQGAIIGAINTVTGSALNLSSSQNAIQLVLRTFFRTRLNNYAPQNQGGGDIGLAAYVDYHLNPHSDAYKWAVFKAMYLGEKARFRRDLLNVWCPLDSSNCAIVSDSELYDITYSSTTQAEGEEYIINNDPNMCGALCEYRVEEWFAEISYGCPDLSTQDSIDIRNELYQYCFSTCNTTNPMAYLLSEDIAASNEDLSAIITTINGACIGAGAVIMNEIGVAYADVYKQYLDLDGNPVCDTIFRIDPCLFAVIEDLNTRLIQSINCDPMSDQVHHNAAAICYDSITIATDGSITVVGGQLSCCTEFYFTDVLDNNVHPCDYDSISNPFVAVSNTGDINVLVWAFGGPNASAELLIFNCVLSVPLGAAAAANGSAYCPYRIDTSCLVVPIDSFVDIDTVWHWCMERLHYESIQIAEVLRQDSISRIIEKVINKRRCLAHFETFCVSYPTREHHYTLYYYDQAGNLIQTVPPEGVDVLPNSAFSSKGQWLGTEPTHSQLTKYQYNTLGQVIWQESPDGGATEFKYDYAQRLRVSRNAKQLVDTTYSYTRYDAEGRIIEVGELEGPQTDFTSIQDDQLNDFTFPSSSDGTLTEVTETEYNVPTIPDNDFDQNHLRGRVALTRNDVITTRYSYDEHGNVTALQHELSDLDGEKQRIDYDYDLISGNVKQVAYQADEYDAFYHRYDYDADNRLTHVATSEDGHIWEEDARYFYYAHGPMARMEIANDKVQGQDYYYSLQGWIKGVNASGNNSHTYEPGKDGDAATPALNNWMARDAMAYSLAYHEQDYKPIGATANLGAAYNDLWTGISGHVLGKNFNSGLSINGLFNGNITAMITDIRRPDATGWRSLQAMSYQYDQLHRIRKGDSHSYDPVNGGMAWVNNDDYKSRYSYDANGNLDTLQRFGPAGLMDDLRYHYNSPSGPNQLSHVDDKQTNTAAYPDDLEDQASGNYSYDAIGNLIKDIQQDLSSIEWTVYGKVAQVNFLNGDHTQFTYDASGNRLTKKRIPGPNSVGNPKTSYYIRDASGNVLSIYEKEELAEGAVIIAQKEVSLYGSARLGLRKFSERILGGGVNGGYRRVRGERLYELSNHLGNVLSTVSDQKEGVAGANLWQADYYEARVTSAQDYYPFGLQMPGRKYSSLLGSRYGFNGKERDDNGEWGITLSNYDYGFRIYNPSIAKFLSVDPLAREFPWNSPYSFAENDVLRNVDLDGAEKFHYLKVKGNNGETSLQLFGIEDIVDYEFSLLQYLSGGSGIVHIRNAREEHEVHDIYTVGIAPFSGDTDKSKVYDTYPQAYNAPDSDVKINGLDKFMAFVEAGANVETGGSRVGMIKSLNSARKASSLLKLSDNTWFTSSGLAFGIGSKHGNRLSHVFDHLINNLDKIKHGVFNLNASGLIKTLDETWAKISKIKWNKSLKAGQSETVDGITRTVKEVTIKGGIKEVRDVFTVKIKNIGIEGGRKGSGKTLDNLKLVTKNNSPELITAFPSKQ